MSISVAKWIVLCSFTASKMTSLLLYTLVSCQAKNFSSFTHVFAHCCLCIQNFHRLVQKNELVHKIIMTQRVKPLLSNVIFTIFRQSPFRTLSLRFMSFLPMHICFDFRLSDPPHFSLCRNVFSTQGRAASIGSSNLFLAFLMVSSNSLSFGSYN